MTFAFPDPLLLAWAAFNLFISLSAIINARKETILGSVVFTLCGVASVSLLKLQLFDAFMYYELGICFLQLMLALNFLDGDRRSARAWITFALGRCYLATGVWFLS